VRKTKVEGGDTLLTEENATALRKKKINNLAGKNGTAA